MHAKCLTCLLCMLFCAPALGLPPASAPARRDIPPNDVIVSARERVHRTLAADYAKTSISDLAALAAKLLAQAGALEESPLRFATLSDAWALAAGAGDVRTAFDAIDELGRAYAVDIHDLRQQALARALAVASGRAECVRLMLLAVESAKTAADADTFDAVPKMLETAEQAGNKSQDLVAISRIQVPLATLRERMDQRGRAARAEALLATPLGPRERAQAHLQVGRYDAFYRRRWGDGLPHLAAGEDAALRDLARDELAGLEGKPVSPLALVERWLNFADSASGIPRAAARDYARDLLATADAAHNETLTRLRARLAAATQPAEAPAAASQPSADTHIVHLIETIDPARDAAQGTWSRAGGSLVCGSSSYASLQLPYVPPEEFDLRAVFTRTAGDGPIALLLATRGRSFSYALDIGGQARFERVDGKIARDNPTVTPVAISNGHRYTLTVQVRRDSVRALLEDKVLAVWNTDFKDLSRYSVWKLNDSSLCGVGAHKAQVTFHSIDLVEITGHGKPSR